MAEGRGRMPSIYDVKPRFQALLRPLARWLARRGVTANAVTILAAVASLALGLALALSRVDWVLLLYPIFLLLRMALNAIDGMLAREFFSPTPLGALLNETGDLVSDAALYLPLALVVPAPEWLIVGIVVVALVGEAAGITAPTIGASRRYDGPLGKSDRAAAFSIVAVCTFLALPAIEVWMPYLLAVLLLLGCLTVTNRMRAALGEIDR